MSKTMMKSHERKTVYEETIKIWDDIIQEKKKKTRVLNQLTESVLHNSDEAEEVLIENNLSLDEIKNEGVIFVDNLVVTNMRSRT